MEEGWEAALNLAFKGPDLAPPPVILQRPCPVPGPQFRVSDQDSNYI